VGNLFPSISAEYQRVKKLQVERTQQPSQSAEERHGFRSLLLD